MADAPDADGDGNAPRGRRGISGRWFEALELVEFLPVALRAGAWGLRVAARLLRRAAESVAEL